MKRLLATLSISIAFAGSVALADSPVTSANFSTAYEDIAMVKTAKDVKRVTPDIAKFLLDTTNPLDVKAAVVEALSWDGDDKAPDFTAALAKKYQKAPRNLDTQQLSADEKALLGYMRTLDDYHNAHKHLKLLKEAHLQAPSSFTIGMLYGLTQAQADFDISWCKTYEDVSNVITNPNLTDDRMRESGIQAIMDYMNLYQDSCYKNN
jgi:hypothetical protein